jgi:hypothetical protein
MNNNDKIQLGFIYFKNGTTIDDIKKMSHLIVYSSDNNFLLDYKGEDSTRILNDTVVSLFGKDIEYGIIHRDQLLTIIEGNRWVGDMGLCSDCFTSDDED